MKHMFLLSVVFTLLLIVFIAGKNSLIHPRTAEEGIVGLFVVLFGIGGVITLGAMLVKHIIKQRKYSSR